MSVDLACETAHCPSRGSHIVTLADGRPRWLCDDCTAWVLAPSDTRSPTQRPIVDLALVVLAVAGYLAGLLLALHGLSRLLSQIEATAGITWLRWAESIAGIGVSVWCWGLSGERMAAWRRRVER